MMGFDRFSGGFWDFGFYLKRWRAGSMPLTPTGLFVVMNDMADFFNIYFRTHTHALD